MKLPTGGRIASPSRHFNTMALMASSVSPAPTCEKSLRHHAPNTVVYDRPYIIVLIALMSFVSGTYMHAMCAGVDRFVQYVDCL